MEILNLEERTIEELKGKEEVVEGTITIGCGEFAAVETLAKICKTYKEKYPLVQIVLHTATADAVYEMMNKGLVDIALFMGRWTPKGWIISELQIAITGVSECGRMIRWQKKSL